MEGMEMRDTRVTIYCSKPTKDAPLASVRYTKYDALGTFGINISALVAGLGLTGFALRFALKDVVSNLIAGSIILLHRPFKINDRIIVVGHEGKVIKIDLRYTTLKTKDHLSLIPNGMVLNKPVMVHHPKLT